MKKVKVTIGICTKNCERTIAGAVESVTIQDFPHKLMEIIVVDGKSRDKTLSIVKNHLSKTDIPLKIGSDEGKGLGVARSIVVDNASGKYIIWVDGDVKLPKNHVREQVEFMEQNSNVGMTRAEWKMYTGKSIVALLESMTAHAHYETRDPKSKATSNLLGTAGSMYRVEALRQVGSFDKNIKGAGEDTDVAARIKAAGWLLSINQEVYHEFRETWKDLWNEYFWWGYGAHYVSHKHKGSIEIWHRLPPVAFIAGILHFSDAYRTTHRKVALLLPLHYVFTRTAWWLGLLNGHIDGYGHFKHQLLEKGNVG